MGAITQLSKNLSIFTESYYYNTLNSIYKDLFKKLQQVYSVKISTGHGFEGRRREAVFLKNLNNAEIYKIFERLIEVTVYLEFNREIDKSLNTFDYKNCKELMEGYSGDIFGFKDGMIEKSVERINKDKLQCLLLNNKVYSYMKNLTYSDLIVFIVFNCFNKKVSMSDLNDFLKLPEEFIEYNKIIVKINSCYKPLIEKYAKDDSIAGIGLILIFESGEVVGQNIFHKVERNFFNYSEVYKEKDFNNKEKQSKTSSYNYTQEVAESTNNKLSKLNGNCYNDFTYFLYSYYLNLQEEEIITLNDYFYNNFSNKNPKNFNQEVYNNLFHINFYKFLKANGGNQPIEWCLEFFKDSENYEDLLKDLKNSDSEHVHNMILPGGGLFNFRMVSNPRSFIFNENYEFVDSVKFDLFTVSEV